MKNEVPCLSCDRKFSSALALSSHTRQKHATNGNGAALDVTIFEASARSGRSIDVKLPAPPPVLDWEYFDLQLSNGIVLRVEKQRGFEMVRKILNAMQPEAAQP